ncbi:hypothetical protein FRX31_028928, partial [Thalictrum thalictroides]
FEKLYGWLCYCCDKKFLDSDLHIEHLAEKYNFARLTIKQKSVLPSRIDQDWSYMIHSGTWKPIESSVSLLAVDLKLKNVEKSVSKVQLVDLATPFLSFTDDPVREGLLKRIRCELNYMLKKFAENEKSKLPSHVFVPPQTKELEIIGYKEPSFSLIVLKESPNAPDSIACKSADSHVERWENVRTFKKPYWDEFFKCIRVKEKFERLKTLCQQKCAEQTTCHGVQLTVDLELMEKDEILIQAAKETEELEHKLNEFAEKDFEVALHPLVKTYIQHCHNQGKENTEKSQAAPQELSVGASSHYKRSSRSHQTPDKEKISKNIEVGLNKTASDDVA